MGLGFPAWDRYLLPVVPLAALLLAWGVSGLVALPRDGDRWAWIGLVPALAMAALMLPPAVESARSQLPLGDTSSWEGIESVSAYVRGQVPGRATILYRDLGWHRAYYMADFPQDFRWFQTEDQLLAEATAAEPAYLLAKSDAIGQADVAALRAAGFGPAPAYVGLRHDGAPSLVLYLVRKER